MALPMPRGLTPPEIAYICEMEMVTVLPRQRLDALELLGGPTTTLVPPHRGNIPLWLALLLKRQRRANIMPPPWLHRAALEAILDTEIKSSQVFSPSPGIPRVSDGSDVVSPPFVLSSISDAPPDALPYHWLEMGELLLEAASDDFQEADQVRTLLRDLREVRMAKLRAGMEALDAGGGVKVNGVGAMELAESRAFLGGVIDGLRRIGISREQARREGEADEPANGFRSTQNNDDEDMDI